MARDVETFDTGVGRIDTRGSQARGTPSMRWPIQLQLLLPILLVVTVAIALASATSGYIGSSQARHQQEDNLRRVIGTLTEASFPLTERVLGQMHGLSGAEFVVLDADQAIEAGTLPIDDAERLALLGLPVNVPIESFSAGPTIQVGGHPYLSHRVIVRKRTATDEAGSLVVLYREDHWRDAARRAAYPALIAGALSTVAAVLVASLLAQRFVRPLRRLGDEAAAVAGGGFHSVTVPDRNDEIRDLALCINGMMEKLGRYESEVRRNERLWTLGQLGAGMAHQLRNSATGARMDIELHQRECGAAGEGKPLEIALRQLRLMETYLQRFLALGRSNPMPREWIDLGELLDDSLELVRPACTHNKVELGFAGPRQQLRVWGEANGLRELMVNLLLNALEAAERRCDVAPRVVVELDRGDSDQAVVRVKDSGPGPTPTTAARLFEPFVSDKADGTGLGLFVARQIAEAHHGSIRWERQDGMTCFVVELPLRGLSQVSCQPRSGDDENGTVPLA